MEEDANDNIGGSISPTTGGIFQPPFNYNYGENRTSNINFTEAGYMQAKENSLDGYTQEFSAIQNYRNLPYDLPFVWDGHLDESNNMMPFQHLGDSYVQQRMFTVPYNDQGNGMEHDYMIKQGKYRKHRVTNDGYRETQKRKKLIISSNTPVIKKVEKSSRGLRHFSKQVCDIVRSRCVTTYLDVADKLVADSLAHSDNPANEQNIRRRVYDALNVLMALGIISKERKQICWRGFPIDNEIADEKEIEKHDKNFRYAARDKTRIIYDILVKVINTKRLVRENRIKRNVMYNSISSRAAVKLPFVLIAAKKDSEISCTVNQSRNEVNFSFLDDFKLTEDSDVLDSLGMGNLSNSNSNVTKEDVLKSFPQCLSGYANLAIGKPYEVFHSGLMKNMWENDKPYYDSNQRNFNFSDNINMNQRAPYIPVETKNFLYRFPHMSNINATQGHDMYQNLNNMN